MYGFSKQPELTARCSPWQHKDLHTFFKYAIFYIVKTVTKDMEKKSCHPSPLAFALRILSIAFIFLWFFVCLFCFVSFVHLLLIALKVTELSQGVCSPWPPSLGCSVSGRCSPLKAWFKLSWFQWRHTFPIPHEHTVWTHIFLFNAMLIFISLPNNTLNFERCQKKFLFA